jgi:superfamily II DNA or RNA helicase
MTGRSGGKAPDPAELTFDRGTILVRGAGAGLGRLRGAGLLWDPRVCAFRCPAHRHGALRQALQSAGIAFRDRLAEDPPRAIRMRRPELRSYQQAALGAWSVAGQRGLVVLPTGAGKTHVALAAMAALGTATLVLVPTRVLLRQWMARAAELLDGTLGLVGDGESRLAPVTVTTFESAYRQMDSFGQRFGLLVVDEAHHFGSGVRTEALEMCPAAARLGLTATPPEEDHELQRLQELLGPVVFQQRVAQLTGRHLAPLEHMHLPVDLTPGEQQLYARERGLFSAAYGLFRRCGGGPRWRDFVRASMVSAEGRRALQGYHRSRRLVSCAERKLALCGQLLQRHPGERVLLFTADNAAAYALSRRLLVPAITCDIGRQERDAVLADLRAGRLRAVVSARVLNEGVDVPEAGVGVIAGGSATGREQVQRVGRLLRPLPGKRAQVYELVVRDTFEESHASRRQRYLVA